MRSSSTLTTRRASRAHSSSIRHPLRPPRPRRVRRASRRRARRLTCATCLIATLVSDAPWRVFGRGAAVLGDALLCRRAARLLQVGRQAVCALPGGSCRAVHKQRALGMPRDLGARSGTRSGAPSPPHFSALLPLPRTAAAAATACRVPELVPRLAVRRRRMVCYRRQAPGLRPLPAGAAPAAGGATPIAAPHPASRLT